MARKYSLDLDEEERSEDFLALKLDGGCQGEDIEGSVLDSSGTPGAAGHALSGVDVLGLSPLNYSGGDFTIDLHHGYVSSKIKGREKAGHLGYPDFTGIKATESPPDDTIITIIEVKKDDEELHEFEAQIFRYMQFAAPKQRAPKLKCFLVCGLATQVWVLESPDHMALPVKMDEYPTTSLRFTIDLHSIAETFWA